MQSVIIATAILQLDEMYNLFFVGAAIKYANKGVGICASRETSCMSPQKLSGPKDRCVGDSFKGCNHGHVCVC